MASTATIQPAWTLQSQGTAAVGRYHDGAFLQQLSTTPNQVYRAGVIPSVGTSGNGVPIDLLTIQTGSPSMGVQIYPGSCVVANASRGPYVAESSVAQTLTVSTADPTNPRWDLVYAQVIDTVASDTGSTITQLGIVTGTPAGSPTLPPLPTNGVCIPLAKVVVPAGVSSVVNANITDLRKSAAVGRGPRFLLGGDALSDPGYCFGELRQRFLTAYGANLVVTDYWGFDSNWHGMNTLPIAQPTQTGFGSLAAGATTTIAAVTIPDPGWPYHIVTGGMVDFGAASASQSLLMSVNVGSTVINTNAITQGQGTSIVAGVGSDVNAHLTTQSSIRVQANGYTGSKTLDFVAQNGSGGAMTVYDGINHGSGAGTPYQWFIMIVPA